VFDTEISWSQEKSIVALIHNKFHLAK